MIELDRASPILLFGGAYSNIQATRALIATAETLGISADRAVCTGDLVAYCADPEATAAAIRAWGCHVVAGNCEEQLAAGAGDCGCGFEDGTVCAALSKGWYPYAASRVSAETRAWMGGLPATLWLGWRGLRLRVLHGGVDAVSDFLFSSDRLAIREALQRSEADIVVAGHCGLPFALTAEGTDGRARMWLNAGAIGMPANDGTPQTWYALLHADDQGVRATWHRLAYDHAAAAAAMRRAGHANAYARSLLTGLWPSVDVLPADERAATGQRLDPVAVTLGTSLPAA